MQPQQSDLPCDKFDRLPCELHSMLFQLRTARHKLTSDMLLLGYYMELGAGSLDNGHVHCLHVQRISDIGLAIVCAIS